MASPVLCIHNSHHSLSCKWFWRNLHCRKSISPTCVISISRHHLGTAKNKYKHGHSVPRHKTGWLNTKSHNFSRSCCRFDWQKWVYGLTHCRSTRTWAPVHHAAVVRGRPVKEGVSLHLAFAILISAVSVLKEGLPCTCVVCRVTSSVAGSSYKRESTSTPRTIWERPRRIAPHIRGGWCLLFNAGHLESLLFPGRWSAWICWSVARRTSSWGTI